MTTLLRRPTLLCTSAPPSIRDALPRGLALVPVLVLVLAGCASVAPPRGTSPPESTPAPAAPPPSTATPAPGAPNSRTAAAERLAIEQRWLQDWFRGTPVRITLLPQGVLAVDVPREFCFDAGSAQVRPALGAVLSKVAESLRRRPAAHLTLLTAPADPGSGAAGTALALQRAQQVQRALHDLGVADTRIAAAKAEGVAAVQLRIGAPAP